MNVQRGKNHIFMNVQSGENYIFMNVQLIENHIFMNESGAQGTLHGVSTDELSHFLGASTTFYTSFIIRNSLVLLYSHLASKVRYIS